MTKIDLIFWILSETECQELIDIAEKYLNPSEVVNGETGKNYMSEVRTSSNYFIGKNNIHVKKIIQRISQEYGVDETQFESFCILKYVKWQKYLPHYDWFDPQIEWFAKHLERWWQRILTVVTYLSDDFTWGGTGFPRLNISFKPKKWTSIVFRWYNEHQELDKDTLHSWEPVETGVKYVITSFVREKEFI